MLDHKNVVKYLGSKQDGLYTFMALELCCYSLHEKLKKDHPKGLPSYELIKMMTDFLLGYGHLRDREIIHGDVKSENILIDSHGNYKIADFGLAQNAPNGSQLSEIAGSLRHCHPVVFELLRWRYLHPKVRRPARTWPATIDIWSIGITFFEAANGTLPFKAKSDATMFKAREDLFILVNMFKAIEFLFIFLYYF